MYVFDSSPSDRSASIENVRLYLSEEWERKQVQRGNIYDLYAFSEEEMPSIFPIKPEQHNGFDCGIFLLTYIENILLRFAKDYQQ